MKYIDGFRDPEAAKALRLQIEDEAENLAGRNVSIMEVCGTHTMSIARYGIREILPETIRLISGPGCPVCVTPAGYIDAAIELAGRGVTIATFGDMLNVPGSVSTLAAARSGGASVEVCYSPGSAVDIANADPRREVVFLAIGFETTIAPVISIVPQAVKRDLANISLLTSFKLVPPALDALVLDPELKIDAFLCPAHVSAIIGSNAYLPVAEKHGIPCVVAGFEPLDILLGIKGILAQVAAGKGFVENQYSRVVKPDGNARAREVMNRYLEPVDADWRGVGVIPVSGLGLKEEYAAFDAEKKFGITMGRGTPDPACMCGDVIKGKSLPPDCEMFGTGCTPDNPIGPCMVSSEGSCSAYYKYSRMTS